MSSSRQRRKVNYKQFNESGSDDDFQEVGPAVKRARKESKKPQPSKQLPPGSSIPKANSTSSTKRVSRDEKAFDRELQQALTVSVDTKILAASDRNPEIPVSKDGVNKASPQTVANKEEGSDYSACEEEDGESSDSDFNDSTLAKKTSSNQKPKPLKKQMAPAVPISTETYSDCHPDVNASGPVATKAKVSTPTALGVTKKPRWTPPAPAGTGRSLSPQLPSGGTPVIRLGLSRNARLKPLHCRTKPPS